MQTTADEQRAAVHSILKEAMAILRDDKPFDPRDMTVGKLFSTWTQKSARGALYHYSNRALSSTTIELVTRTDPEDYSDDRSKVKIVPAEIRIHLSPMIAGLPDTEIKVLLQLEDFWVDSHDNRRYGNEIMPRHPSMPNAQDFRYRSKNIPGSKFPIDVELGYANPLDGSLPQMLSIVRLSRDYTILTPEERRQRRLEERQAKRQKYGEMNLCTGMLCPETGLWEGYSAVSSSDQLVVYKGKQFPKVRTLTPHEEHEQRQATEFVAGQWMWLRGQHDHPVWWAKDPEFDEA
ncbi:hypothetical protein VL15_02985 [Burkholderia cepacia]|uniref:Uncharacterized protein n=1 Tax=Burkholderia cepacia TaxID=292 RepID=A0A0J5XIF3_BURCE|nr:hypothetical protein [Burkholderia cepacia]KML62532.1 hypothetical protein VL15_02985 [Burkholderia cepacia]